jgi:hypothetical protein
VDKASLFVSYRRQDTAGHAGRLVDRLRQEFGRDQVFMDIDIPVGVNFVEHIDRTIGAADVLIVLIGDDWLALRDDREGRRLDDPSDFVRSEIRAALQRGLVVIPVLVERASMPRHRDLPEDIRRLSQLNALELSDSRWDYDVGLLVAQLRTLVVQRVPDRVQPPAPQRSRVGARVGAVVGVAVLLAVIGVGVWAVTTLRGEPGCEPGAGTATISLSPATGPAGTEILVTGRGFAPGKQVSIYFHADQLDTLLPEADGSFALRDRVPTHYAGFPGNTYDVMADQRVTFCEARAEFTVT